MKMKRLKFLGAGGIGVIVLLIAVFGIVSANGTTTIDFEGFGEGDVVSVISDSNGDIGVHGFNPDLGGGVNAAMIFDAECVGGCSGGDDDLNFPGHGNVLIITEDQNSSDPDDADAVGSYVAFDFSAYASGTVTVESVDIGDVEFAEGEVGAEVRLYGPGPALITTVALPNTGDNNIETLGIGVDGVEMMVVQLNGSGAIDNLQINTVPAFARITGGGWRVIGINGDGIRVSNGLTLHCDITLANNLQINWNGGQKWHINKTVDAAFCLDDPDFTPEPPAAPADTFIGYDLGKLNNSGDAVACFIFTDHGEGGHDPDGIDDGLDQALIRIWDIDIDPGITQSDLEGDDPCQVLSDPPALDPDTVLFVDLQDIAGGNLQFHFDQPHKNGNN